MPQKPSNDIIQAGNFQLVNSGGAGVAVYGSIWEV